MNFLLFRLFVGPKGSNFSPHSLAKNLTPKLLKSRKRFETMSADSTTDTEGGISPLWEFEEVSGCEATTVHVLLFALKS